MDKSIEDLVYERKIDQISEQIEELILDAMLSALEKIKRRNIMFLDLQSRPQTEDIKF
ncbi:MAG: hypothetical protein U9O82_01175 [Thermodesulfobacteriota bacterium]|nr:hypothetical protein [Thermodesulfobacteriota bacterium]